MASLTFFSLLKSVPVFSFRNIVGSLVGGAILWVPFCIRYCWGDVFNSIRIGPFKGQLCRFLHHFGFGIVLVDDLVHDAIGAACWGRSRH
jgi:hypothetical protein